MPYARAADGVRLHYEVLGRNGAPVVLMIQGLGADKHGWDMQLYLLAMRYRVVAFDNRGAGRSDKPFNSYSLEQMADDAVAVLDQIGVQSAHVVGASMGGAISLLVASRHPQRVDSLVLACTAGRNHQWRRELLDGWATAATEQGMGAMTREAARWVIGPRSFRRLMPMFGWLGPLAMGRPAHAFTAQVRAIVAHADPPPEMFASITAPALVIVGNQDILTPRGDSEELVEQLPNAELVVISGAAHGLMIEHATTFNRVLFEFLGRVTRTQRAAAADSEACASSAGRVDSPAGVVAR
ncbi:MAG: alpha/beta fold hydrolase [Ilumatobacteraceae bacterium]